MWNYCVVWEYDKNVSRVWQDDKDLSYPYMILPEIVHLVMGSYCVVFEGDKN